MFANMIYISIAINAILICSFAGLSEEAVYYYWKQQGSALKKLDLNTLGGKWYSLYQKDRLDQNSFCPEIDIVVTDGHINVTHTRTINGEQVSDEFQLEQNKHLEGKLERLHKFKTMTLGYPWWVFQADPVLVVHQTYKLNADVDDTRSYDTWTIYGRDTNVDDTVLESAIQKLIKGGAVADSNGNVGYRCMSD